jgi:hypothetical protein
MPQSTTTVALGRDSRCSRHNSASPSLTTIAGVSAVTPAVASACLNASDAIVGELRAKAKRDCRADDHFEILYRNGLRLDGGHELFRLSETKPEVGQICLLIALEACDFHLRRLPSGQLRHQLDPPHQPRHPTHPRPLNPERTLDGTNPTDLYALLLIDAVKREHSFDRANANAFILGYG